MTRVGRGRSIRAVERRLLLQQHALDVLPRRAEQERRRLPRDAGDVRRQQQPRRGLAVTASAADCRPPAARWNRHRPPRRRDDPTSRLAASAASSTMPPREAWIRTAPVFMRASSLAPIRFCVAGSSGTCSETTSAGREQFVERHRTRIERRRDRGIDRRRIEEAQLRAHALERLRHRAADGAEADQADQQALDARRDCRRSCGRGTCA